MYINALNNFRALAIVLIVMVHIFPIVFKGELNIYEGVFLNLISGGTTLFVFISGFLFHHVFFLDFNYKQFMLKKAKNVLVPYLILSFLPVVLLVLINKPSHGDFFLGSDVSYLELYIVPLFKYYLTGRHLIAYWYIPFIALMFSISPLVMTYLKLDIKKQCLIIIILSLLSMLIHRPLANINPLQSLIYYLPIYLIGALTSCKYKYVCKLLKDKEIWLLFMIIFLAIYQYGMGVQGNFHKAFFSIERIDISYVQKILMCFMLLAFLSRYENFKNGKITMLTNTSFAVFFLHPFFLVVLNRVSLIDDIENSFIYKWTCLFGITSLVVIICILIAISVKKYVPKFSRNLIGY